jgi:hypothetical protein
MYLPGFGLKGSCPATKKVKVKLSRYMPWRHMETEGV